MALVISSLGTVSDLSEDQVDEASWNAGCIHIRQRGQSVIMSVAFDRLTGPAIAAALYELGDMQPKKICFASSESGIPEVLIGFELAFHRLCTVFASANIPEECTGMPSLPGPIDSDFVKYQSGSEVIDRQDDRNRSVPEGRSGTDG
jgi:hypothetical protein